MHNGAADYIIAVESKASIMPIHHHAAGALNQGRSSVDFGISFFITLISVNPCYRWLSQNWSILCFSVKFSVLSDLRLDSVAVEKLESF